MKWNTTEHANIHQQVRDFAAKSLTPSVDIRETNSEYERFLDGILLNRFTI